MFKATGERSGKVYLEAELKSDIFRLLKDKYPSMIYPTKQGDASNRNGNGKPRTPIYPEPIKITEVR